MTTLPFQFTAPNEDVISIIGVLLQQLPLLSEAGVLRQFRRSEQEEAHRATFSELCDVLRTSLSDDYSQLVADAKAAPYLFEYVVDSERAGNDQLDARGLGIWTRLFSHKRGGSVLYGRRIFRIGADAYLYWLE